MDRHGNEQHWYNNDKNLKSMLILGRNANEEENESNFERESEIRGSEIWKLKCIQNALIVIL